MYLVRLDAVSLAFGARKLLLSANLAVNPGERVCLVGRNGAGKTSLLGLITGQAEPDEGEVRRGADLCVSQLAQVMPRDQGSTVAEFVAAGLADILALAGRYRARTESKLDSRGLRELETLHAHIEAHGGWHPERQVEMILTEMGLPAARSLAELSGGWQRRAALARAVVSKPDLLLLDEPTNHLDFEAIEWLERHIEVFPGTVLFITHDRTFLQRLATRIVEIDRGQLRSWPGDYARYLTEKAAALATEQRHNAEFDRILAGEEAWIREGIKARRTRNEGRVRALQGMREARARRTKIEAPPRIHIEEAESSGRKVLEARRLCFGYGDTRLINDFSLRIRRGDRIGLVGNNGVGKSTLLQLLLGELQPDSGSIKWGVNLETGYFDQHRREVDLGKTVAQVVGDGRDYVILDGKPRHVVGYLKGFLFSAEQALTPVRALSGGERNRVILARLFTRAANLLVLDEPTNDLDVETLEVLEGRLAAYTGTLIVVSHDRTFLDNTVTSILAFEQDGRIRHYAGGYSDWARRGRLLASVEESGKGTPGVHDPTGENRSSARSANKLSYKLQREMNALPDAIEHLEQEIQQLQAQTLGSGFYDQAYQQKQPVLDELARLEVRLEQQVGRWVELAELDAALRGNS